MDLSSNSIAHVADDDAAALAAHGTLASLALDGNMLDGASAARVMAISSIAVTVDAQRALPEPPQR